MENQSKTTTLQKKIALLTALREGNIEKSHELLQELSQTTKTQPQLYQKFNKFVSDHKSQIIQAQNEERQERVQQPQIVLVEGDSDDSWKTDDSISLSSQDEKQTQKVQKKQPKQETTLLKNIVNSKSAILLKPLKEVKRQFLIQTKPKQNINHSSTLNLRHQRTRSNPKQPQQLLKTQQQATKPYIVHKKSIKQSDGPHFPPINSSKPYLKL